jgi:hypothetical protein
MDLTTKIIILWEAVGIPAAVMYLKWEFERPDKPGDEFEKELRELEEEND